MSAIDDRLLGDLLALEREHDDMPAGAEARMLAGIEGIIGGGGGPDGGDDPSGGSSGPSVAPAAGAAAVKASPWLARAAWLALGAAGGASGHAIATSSSAHDAPVAIVSAAPSATIARAESVVDASIATLTIDDLPSARVGAPEAPRAVTPKPSASTTRADDGRIAQERTDLDVARAALAHGRADAALDAIKQHVKTYGEGHFAEEREVLAVQSLVAAGRKPEAATRAAKFREKYPNSLFGPAISQAITPAEK